MLSPVENIPSYAVIIRAIHERGQTQIDAICELERRGLWLTEEQKRLSGADEFIAARRTYVSLFCDDVAARPDCYKASVIEAPGLAAKSIIDGLDLDGVKTLVRDLREEIRKVEGST